MRPKYFDWATLPDQRRHEVRPQYRSGAANRESDYQRRDLLSPPKLEGENHEYERRTALIGSLRARACARRRPLLVRTFLEGVMRSRLGFSFFLLTCIFV